MKLLLHICCAPCAIHPFEDLKNKETSEITGFFYNPNIHPYTEYINRKNALTSYSKTHNLPVIFHRYDIENFFRSVSGNEEFGARCETCWRIRLEETAAFAAKNNYDSFTTTLLVSPYQDQGKLERISKALAKRYGVNFLYKDFRSGFRAAQNKAKAKEMYRQKYCGCVFSERERFNKRPVAQR